jgi:hypothetical protein
MMGMRTLFFALLASVLSLSSACCQEIDLIGRAGWQAYSKKRLEVYADQILNTRGAGLSGYLRFTVWATVEEDTGGDFSGSYAIAALDLDRLDAGDSYQDLDYLVYFYPPPPGLFYTSVSVEELVNNQYEVRDWIDLRDSELPANGIVNFGGVGEGRLDNLESNGDVTFLGDVTWNSNAGDGRVIVTIDEIRNERSEKTGPLRLQLIATEQPYDPNSAQTTWTLAKKGSSRLKPGWGFQSFYRSLKLDVPPEGEYYVTLVLEEKFNKQWVPVDFAAFPGTSIF